MNTPICDFVRRYAESGITRFHMPGHKGAPLLGLEHLDITEIQGADSLYEASGIIAESEANASVLFGCPTFYSTEGSSQCIRAMVYLAMLHAKAQGIPFRIAAGRNAHKTFLSAAALLDAQVDWLWPEGEGSYLSCTIEPSRLDALLAQRPAAAVYITSPDYLGHVADVAALAAVCHRHGALLLVDNAHGAYLRFLPESRHPMDLGADLCCDSAHKTLPVLTGGAYLHIRSEELARNAKTALAIFGSTSPSYLILQSLDAANAYLAAGYGEKLDNFAREMENMKARLMAFGYVLDGHEPLKLTVCPKSYGYTGTELADFLRQREMECEFADPDYLVLMLTPEMGFDAVAQMEAALLSLPKRSPVFEQPPRFSAPQRVMSVREAMFAPCETIPMKESLGRVLAAATVGCPPAVPIVVSGEMIDEAALQTFAYYGIDHCAVVL